MGQNSRKKHVGWETKQENERHVREALLSKMEESMKEGLDMCYRLNKGKKKIDHLPIKDSILEILKKYPKRFPKELYLPDEPVSVFTFATANTR